MTLLQQFAESVTGSGLASEFKKTRLVLTGLFALLLGVVLFINALHTFDTARNGFAGFALPPVSDVVDSRGWRINQTIRDQLELRRAEALYNVRFSTITSSIGILVLLSFIVWIALYFLLKPLASFVQEKEKFVSQASHELRTPLAVLYSDLSLSKDSQDVNELRSVIASSQKEIKRLQLLSDKLLGRATFVHSTTLNVKTLIDKIWSDLQLHNHNMLTVEILVSQKLTIKTDEERFYQLVYSLVENALKHAKKSTPLVIEYRKKSNTLVVANTTTASQFQGGVGIGVQQDLAKELGMTLSHEIQQSSFVAELKVK